MKIIKVIYDNKTKFILDIIKKFKDKSIIETFNYSSHTEARRARPMQTRFGTKNLPLIVFEDENLEEVAAIWPEQNPEWELEISKKLIELHE